MLEYQELIGIINKSKFPFSLLLLLFYICLFVKKGTDGPNKYAPDPLLQAEAETNAADAPPNI